LLRGSVSLAVIGLSSTLPRDECYSIVESPGATGRFRKVAIAMENIPT
jgi:hypothetical protein